MEQVEVVEDSKREEQAQNKVDNNVTAGGVLLHAYSDWWEVYSEESLENVDWHYFIILNSKL